MRTPADASLVSYIRCYPRRTSIMSLFERLSEVRQRIGRLRLDFERGGNEPIGFSGSSFLQLERAQQMQGVEMQRGSLHDARVDFFRLVELALLVQRERLLQGLRHSVRDG